MSQLLSIKSTMRLLILLALTIAMTGCATTPTPRSSAKPVPADRMLAFQSKTPDRSGEITVIRDSGHMGGFCYVLLSINSTASARIDVSESATFHVPPGEILFRVGRDPHAKGLCAGPAPDLFTQRETYIKVGESKNFRLMIGADGQLDIQRAD